MNFNLDFKYILIILIITVVSVILHELSHGIVAYWLGDRTAKDAGRLTFNPIKHIDPYMSILVPVVLYILNAPVFGGAKPVPVNHRNLKWHEWGMALVAFAGPFTNFLLAFISFLIGYSSGLIDGAGGEVWQFFFAEFVYQPVYHTRAAVSHCRAYTVNGVGADHIFGSAQIDRRQKRAVLCQGVERDTDSRGDNAAAVREVLVNIGEHGRRAHKNHNQRAAVLFKSAHAAADYVAAQGFGTVDLKIHTRFQSGADDKALFAGDDFYRVSQFCARAYRRQKYPALYLYCQHRQ